MSLSDRWNPIGEVRSELDAHLLTQIIMENTEGPTHRPGGSDEFWERSEQNLLNALVLYAVHDMKTEERSLAGIYDFLTCGSFDELDGTFRCLPDDHPAKRPYNLFCMAEPKTRGNIAAGLGTRLPSCWGQPLEIQKSPVQEAPLCLRHDSGQEVRSAQGKAG